MIPLNELYQLEKHLEKGFKELLLPACENIYISRECVDLKSNRIELKAILGANLEHRKAFSNGQTAFDAWLTTLEITLATNRSVDDGIDNHSLILGNVRSLVTLRNTDENFSSDVIAIDDLRDSGTLNSFVDENNIDITTLSFYLVINVKPTAWPQI